MKNVTKLFQSLMESNINWVNSLFYDVIEKLGNNNIQVSYWEGEENWASIIVENKLIGYIWKKYPLIVLEKSNSHNVKFMITNLGSIYYIEVDSLDKDLFKIDDVSLRSYFDGHFNFSSFTMEDLWYYTNSI